MKEKILNILIVFLLTILLIDLFSWNKELEKNSGLLVFKMQESTYTIPASPVLLIENNTWKDIVFNTCNDLVVNFSWEKVLFSDDFCSDLEIKSNTKTSVEFNKYYDNFARTWIYNFLIKLDWKDYITQTEIENKWAITKLFVWLLYAPLYNLTIFFVEIFWNSLWWSIVAITIVIRLILLRPQHKMMISQRKLQAIQPKIKEIQEKYKWNNQMLWMEMMKLYKEEKVNPFWSCWLLLIQMPILLVVYNIFITIKDYSNVYYLYDFFGKYNLDAIWHDFFWIDLLWYWWLTGLLLWLVVAIIQYVQVKLSLIQNNTNKTWVVLEKKKDEKDYSSFMPDPEFLNKFMLYWLPVMVWVFTYSLLAWVWIYWWISTLFTIFQQLIVNKIVKK